MKNELKQGRIPRLMYAIPEQSPDFLYACGFMAPDAMVWIDTGEKTILAASPLEYGRALKSARVDHVEDLSQIVKRSKDSFPAEVQGECRVILQLCREAGLSRLEVARDFPLALADKLRAQGIALEVSSGSQLPGRIRKDEREISAISEVIATTESALARVKSILGASSPDPAGFLWWEGEVLTSERLHYEIEVACLSRGAVAHHPIVAGGDQACDPHERGSGPLRAGELIIVDIFPRCKKSSYWGDLTRTFLKGKATADQIRLVAAVREAQLRAFEVIHAGVVAGDVHREVELVFEARGYQSGVEGGVYTGFFHGTGHGLGLDIHEAPRLGGKVETVLKEGMVVTVEPGLYYPGLGGCRIEDDVVVEKAGLRMLSQFPYDWIIP